MNITDLNFVTEFRNDPNMWDQVKDFAGFPFFDIPRDLSNYKGCIYNKTMFVRRNKFCVCYILFYLVFVYSWQLKTDKIPAYL